MSYGPMISVVLTTYNCQRLLRLCLLALKGQSFDKFEIIVVDDGSSDSTESFTRELVIESQLSITYVRQEDRGFRLAAARNLGLRYATGLLVIFLDDDKLPSTGFLQAHWNAFLRDTCSLNVGRILYVSDEEVSSLLNTECLDSEFWTRIQSSAQADPRDKLPPTPAYELAWGGNISVSRLTALLLNGFDEEFVEWGGEDLDFANRFFRWGGCITRIDNADVFHLGHYEYSKNHGGQDLYLTSKMEADGPVRESCCGTKELITVSVNRRHLGSLQQLVTSAMRRHQP